MRETAGDRVPHHSLLAARAAELVAGHGYDPALQDGTATRDVLADGDQAEVIETA